MSGTLTILHTSKETGLTEFALCIVDEEDIEKVIQYKWIIKADKRKKTIYARTNIPVGNGKYKTVYMHQLIMGFPNSLVDHIDGDGLHNSRKNNLRLATIAENNRNRKLSVKNKTGYKGVREFGNKYRAEVSFNGKKYSCGLYYSAEEAHEAVQAKRRELHGEFARDK